MLKLRLVLAAAICVAATLGLCYGCGGGGGLLGGGDKVGTMMAIPSRNVYYLKDDDHSFHDTDVQLWLRNTDGTVSKVPTGSATLTMGNVTLTDPYEFKTPGTGTVTVNYQDNVAAKYTVTVIDAASGDIDYGGGGGGINIIIGDPVQ